MCINKLYNIVYTFPFTENVCFTFLNANKCIIVDQQWHLINSNISYNIN